TTSEITVPASDTATGHDEERTAEEARPGHTGDHVRYILGFSFAGVVIAFIIGYLFFFEGRTKANPGHTGV
ncbi:MAG: hypothetical protein RIC52_10620, partial [Amphiplicatus sp.]